MWRATYLDRLDCKARHRWFVELRRLWGIPVLKHSQVLPQSEFDSLAFHIVEPSEPVRMRRLVPAKAALRWKITMAMPRQLGSCSGMTVECRGLDRELLPAPPPLFIT